MNHTFFLLLAPEPEDIAGWVSIGVIVLVAALSFALLPLMRQKQKTGSRMLVYGALCIAASFTLSVIPVVKLPFDGTITLASFVPVVFFAYMFGFVPGLMAGLVYGALQFLASPYVLTPLQVVLDYPVAFMSIAAAPAFKRVLKEKAAVICGMVLVGVLRLAAHTLAGIQFFNAGYIYEGLPVSSAFLYSFCYNLIYVAPDIAIAIAAMCALLFSGAFKQLKAMALKDAPPAPPQPAVSSDGE